jgi:predicted phosphodiesterase
MEAKLLCVGDMHLGRRPSRIPADLELDPASLTPAAAWRRVVALAISERVDAVLLAGDVVESDNRYFEAYTALERGVRELAGARIQVVAVAGNHDVDVLPRLADEIAAFHLLGRGGRWETHDIVRDGRTLLRIIGWSFPERVVERSPLESFDPPQDRDAPLIGLLHCDLDATASRYAPVALRELERYALDAWLLGHVHKPSLTADDRRIGYLGSLQGLDPSETGARGPWMLRVGGAATLSLEHLSLAPLLWEELEVSVDDVEESDGVESRIVRALSALHERNARESRHVSAVGCRIQLVGRTRPGVNVRPLCAQGALAGLRPSFGGTQFFVERVVNATQPALDLEALARRSDPPGLLAARLLELRRADAADGEATKPLRHVADQAAWQDLESVDLSEAAVRARLIRVGTRALEDLLAQSTS